MFKAIICHRFESKSPQVYWRLSSAFLNSSNFLVFTKLFLLLLCQKFFFVPTKETGEKMAASPLMSSGACIIFALLYKRRKKTNTNKKQKREHLILNVCGCLSLFLSLLVQKSLGRWSQQLRSSHAPQHPLLWARKLLTEISSQSFFKWKILFNELCSRVRQLGLEAGWDGLWTYCGILFGRERAERASGSSVWGSFCGRHREKGRRLATQLWGKQWTRFSSLRLCCISVWLWNRENPDDESVYRKILQSIDPACLGKRAEKEQGRFVNANDHERESFGWGQQWIQAASAIR